MKVSSFLYIDKKWSNPLPEFKPNDKSLVLVFGNNKEKVLELINENPNVMFAGAMSSGNIFGGAHYEKDDSNEETLVLTYLEFDKTKLKIFTEPFSSYEDSYNAGKRLYEKLNTQELSGILTFTEGLKINGAKFAEGLNTANTKKIPIVGGLAGDNLQFVETMIFDSTGLAEMSVLGIGFYGDSFKMLCESMSGVSSFGIERKVTKSEKNILYEINGQPALDIYEEFLGEKSVELPAAGLHFPVELSSNFQQKEGLLRTPIDINRENKSIIFTGEIPEKDENGEPNYIRLMLAQKDSLTTASELVSMNLKKKIPEDIRINKKFLALSISCAARKAVLKTDLDDELSAGYEILETLNELEEEKSNLPKNKLGKISFNPENHVGFYSYGEIVSLNDSCCLVNQTMSQIILYEE